MTAMDGATRNAGELIKKLTIYYNKTRQAAITRELMDIVYYNKTRQAAITRELMDIVGGAEALR